MLQIQPFETHTAEYEAWFEKYHHVYLSELLAIRRNLEHLPENIHGIEVGLGTGRFAGPLGIKEGVEPAASMREIAIKRGVEVVDAKAEHLPYKDLRFDFVLFVTIAHLDNAQLALMEANRVLKRNGSVIMAFIDKDSPLARKYERDRKKSLFYRHARFYSVAEITTLLFKARFKDPVFTQTLFDDIDDILEVEEPREGHGEGSFVVARTVKR